MPQPRKPHWVALALFAATVAVYVAGIDARYGCDTGVPSGGDGPAWPIVDGHAAIPPGTQTVPNSAFFKCASLVSVDIPASVTYIDDHALGDTGLVSVAIPNSVTSLGAFSFAYTKLVSVEIPNRTQLVDATFFGSSELVDIKIPQSLNINPNAGWFAGCGCDNSLYVAGATLCDCAASSKWPCTGGKLPACTGSALESCAGLGMCCNLDVYDCVCTSQGTASEIAAICGQLKNGGIDCDHCKASPRCNHHPGLADV